MFDVTKMLEINHLNDDKTIGKAMINIDFIVSFYSVGPNTKVIMQNDRSFFLCSEKFQDFSNRVDRAMNNFHNRTIDVIA